MEYAEKIEEKTTPSISHNLLELLALLPNVYAQDVFYNWNLIVSDPDDNKFVDCYIAASADYLVSNDRHFIPHAVRFYAWSKPKIRLLNFESLVNVANRMHKT